MQDVYKDFDIERNEEEEQRTAEHYQMSYDSVLKETLWMICLQMVSNLFLLVPLHITGGAKIFLLIDIICLPFSFQGEGETLCSCPQHWDVCKGE